MTFKDLLQKNLLGNLETMSISAPDFVLLLVVTAIIAFFIFLVYRFQTRDSFYSKSFGISLVGVALVTASIIVTIQSNLVISLGMVGALSIVRFRTAIKEPMDLLYLFWSISVGIICGARLTEIALILSLVLTIVVFALNALPNLRAPILLVIRADSVDREDEILDTVKKFCRNYRIKSRNFSMGALNLIIELRSKDENELMKALSLTEGISSVSVLTHDGEAVA